jgi:stearoyl-CoA desaturase (delta-9 desaturase)
MCRPTESNDGPVLKDTRSPEEIAAANPWTERDVNWGSCCYQLFIHTAAVVGACAVPSASWATLGWALALLFLSELGITGGVHRLWSHRSYSAALPFRIFLALCAQVANQGSIYHWVRDHRVHHLCSETEADPHNASQGFLFAHIGWLLVKKTPEVIAKGKTIDMSDMLADPVVYLDKILFPWSNLLMCFVVAPSLAVYGWGETWYTAVMVCGFLRYCFGLHHTWCVNSFAHLLGDRPYDPNINPAENFIVSILANGEGWHNYHHAYPYDYSASEHGWTVQYNPTTFVIDAFAFFGMAWNLKKATKQWERRQARNAGGHHHHHHHHHHQTSHTKAA